MRYLIIIIFFFPCLALAQSPFQFEIETRSGFEYNVFNAYKRTIVTSEEGEEINTFQSGFFQHINFQVDWKKKINSHKLSFRGITRMNYFPTLLAANLFRPELNLGYAFQFDKKSSLYLKSKYLLHRTNRIPDQVEVLSIPSAYQRMDANLGLKFQAFKQNKMLLEMNLNKKSYAPFRDRIIQYSAIGLKFRSTQMFGKKVRTSDALALEMSFNQRNYLDTPLEIEEDFEDEEDEEEDEDFEDLVNETVRRRVWQYYTIKSSYTLRVSKNTKWKMGLAFQQRQDRLDQVFGYHQMQSFVELKMKKKKLELKWRVSGTHRVFSNLKADKAKTQLLRHQYLRSSIRADYKIKKRWFLCLHGNLTKRWRNLPENYRNNFLPYLNGSISLGVKYKF